MGQALRNITLLRTLAGPDGTGYDVDGLVTIVVDGGYLYYEVRCTDNIALLTDPCGPLRNTRHAHGRRRTRDGRRGALLPCEA